MLKLNHLLIAIVFLVIGIFIGLAIYGRSNIDYATSVNIITTAITTLATIVIAAYAVAQQNSQKQIIASQDNQHKDQLEMQKKVDRAYIVLGGPTPIKAQDGVILVYLQIANRGKTPANLLGLKIGFCEYNRFMILQDQDYKVSDIIREHKLEDTIKFDLKDYSDFLAVGADSPFSRVNFRQEDYPGYVFFGIAYYRDVFQIDHYSTFKLKLGINPGSSAPLPGCYEDWH